MKDTIINICYSPDKGDLRNLNLFELIWKVNADDSYYSHHIDGFNSPAIFITQEGEGQLCLYERQKKRNFLLKENSFFIVEPDKRISYRCPKDKRWRFYFINFFNLKIVNSLGLKTSYCYELTFLNLLSNQVCENIIYELITKESGYYHVVDSLLLNFFVQISRPFKKSSKESFPIREVKLWMSNNLQEKIKIDTLLSIACMSRTKFFKEFKKNTATSPVHYYLNLKLDSAALMLRTTNKSIKEITHTLNFYDQYHFSKLFKNRYKLSPSFYRTHYNNDSPPD